MRATAIVRFERKSDGSLSHIWSGGRRVEITTACLRALNVRRPFFDRAIDLGMLRLRIVAHGRVESGTAIDTYIAMKDGILARVIAQYVTLTLRALPYISTVERRLRRWKDGDTIPKASLTGLLVRTI